MEGCKGRRKKCCDEQNEPRGGNRISVNDDEVEKGQEKIKQQKRGREGKKKDQQLHPSGI